jgi:hypothetical protein
MQKPQPAGQRAVVMAQPVAAAPAVEPPLTVVTLPGPAQAQQLIAAATLGAVLVSPGLVTAATGPALRRVKLAMAGVSRGRVLAPFAGLVPVPLRPAQPVLVFDS